MKERQIKNENEYINSLPKVVPLPPLNFQKNSFKKQNSVGKIILPTKKKDNSLGIFKAKMRKSQTNIFN